MTWIIEFLVGLIGPYLKELLIGAGALIAVFFAKRSGKKAGRREVERETQEKHAHDVGLSNEAENAHRNRTERERQESWDAWTVK